MRNSPSSSEDHRLSQALAALNQIGQTLLVIQDLPETLRKIAESTRDVLNADIVDLYEYIQERDEFILPPILCGERRDPYVPKEKIYADDVVVKIVKAGRPQYYPDACQTDALTEGFVARADAPKNRFVVREGVESSVSLPLMAGDETVGVMFVNYRVKQTFDAEQRTLIEAFSNLAALAIFNARLYQSEHERRLRYETLQETARVVNESLSPKEVSEHALEQLHKVVEFSSASVQLFEGDHRIVFSVRAFQLISEASRLHRDLSEDALVSKIIHNRQPLVLGNVLAEPLWEVLPETSHIQSWIGAPLIAKGEVIGLLTVDHQTVGYYNSQHGEVVAAFASQLAVAMHNSIQAQALAHLNQLSQRLVSLSEESGKFHQLLEEIAKSAKEVLRADIIELYEYSQAKEEYKLPQISIGERRGPVVLKKKIYADDVILQLINRDGPTYVEKAQGDTVITSDYTIKRKYKPSDRFAIREEIQSTAAIPLKAGDEPVGLMFANYRTPQRFPREQQELIELFANQAAIAIQNARLYKRLNVLGEIGQQLTANLRLQEHEILDLVHERAGELMDAQNMYIALYDEKTDTINFGLAFTEGKPLKIEARKIDDQKRGRTEEIIRTGQPIFIASQDESLQWYKKPGRAEYVGKVSPSWIGVPMLTRNRVVGVIATYHPDKDNIYGQDDLNILQAIANQAAIALDNSRTFQALVDFGQEVSAGIGLQEDEILKLIYDQASKLMDTNNMYIALYDDRVDEISFGLAFQAGKPITITARKIDDAKRGRTEEIIRTQQPLFIPTRKKSIEWYAQPGHAEFIDNPLASWVGVPMMAEEKVLGVVATYHPDQDHVYTEGDVRILQSMANIAAVAIENARRYADVEEANARLESANAKIAQNEAVLVRTMIAADFVHHLNNLAGTIPIWVGRIKKRMKAALPENDPLLNEVEKYLAKIVQDNDRLLREGEQIKSMPAPEILQVDDLLQSLVHQAYVQMPVEVEIRYEQKPLPPIRAVASELSNSLWCVLENGVDAMLPKGGVLEINTQVELGDHQKKWLQIEIKDHGKGIKEGNLSKIFQPFQSTKKGHMGYGLWRTKNIIDSLGGEITFKSLENQGTTFQIKLPVLEA